jgi:hypothetical protein
MLLTSEVKIQGTKPLLWNHFGPESIPLVKLEKSGVAGNDPTEWKKSVLVTPENQLYLLPAYIFGAIRDGAKFTKRGRGSIQSSVTATLQIVDEIVLTDRFLPADIENRVNLINEDIYLDVRTVKNPATKGRNVRYRVAASPGWNISFTILWEGSIVSRNEINAAIIDSGRLIGLGDGRAIGFGRYELVKMTTTEVIKSA